MLCTRVERDGDGPNKVPKSVCMLRCYIIEIDLAHLAVTPACLSFPFSRRLMEPHTVEIPNNSENRINRTYAPIQVKWVLCGKVGTSCAITAPTSVLQATDSTLAIRRTTEIGVGGFTIRSS